MSLLGTRLDLRLVLLIASLLGAIAAYVGFRLVREQKIVDAVAVVDITGSMNTRDMGNPRGSESRLESVRQALTHLAQTIPCKSRLGLGLFTERKSFLLFDPVEVCGNYDALQGAFSELDWRMAWEGDSFIAKGLYSAIGIAQSLKADLIFLTDGHEAPPLPASGVPEFEGKPGDVKGLIVGVGGSEKTPIPKFDDDGRQSGVYGVNDVPHDNRIGPPPVDAEAREGYNARNAPFGAMPAVGEEHLTSVRTAYLKDLSQRTGLDYVELQHTAELSAPLMSAARGRQTAIPTDMSYVPASIALALMLLVYAAGLMERRAESRDNAQRFSLFNQSDRQEQT